MNRCYYIMGIGLLSVASLTSCEEDVIEKDTRYAGSLSTYTVYAGIQGYGSDEEGLSTRANVQENGKSFMWNTGDRVTIWDGAKGYAFAAEGDDLDANPSRKVTFTGEASFEDEAKVWGIYPAQEAVSTPLSFTLSNVATQPEGGKPALQHTMYMLAEGVVEGNTVQRLNFNHLTALFQFDLTNQRESEVVVKSLSVEADSEIFPTELTVATNDGLVCSYAGKKNVLTLNMPQSVIKTGESATGYMNFFPTEGMTGETELTFSLVISTNEDGKGEVEENIVVKKATINALYSKPGALVPTEGYVAGKRYIVNLSIAPTTEDSGYTQDGNNYTIIKSGGLKALPVEVWSSPDATITLDTDIDMKEEGNWTPVATLAATLDGNNHSISNLTISSEENSGLGLFVTNNGTIKNLSLNNVTANYGYQLGLFAADNKGSIENCSVNGAVIDVSGGDDKRVGILVGVNSGVILDCRVEGRVTVGISSKHTAGGIAGENAAGTIKGAFVGSDVVITNSSEGGDLGGIVGWINGGTLDGCCSLATIKCTGTTAISLGGLIGSAWASNDATIIASHAGAKIESTTAWCTMGGLIGQGGGDNTKSLTSCYSTSLMSGKGDWGGITKTNSNFECNSCYFMNCDYAVSNNGSMEGAEHLTTVDELHNRLDNLNGQSDGISEYKFEVDSSGGETPLKIVKK